MGITLVVNSHDKWAIIISTSGQQYTTSTHLNPQGINPPTISIPINHNMIMCEN